jgi:acylphosphatase
MIEAAHIVVHGRVQGVWFRAGTKEQADELGLLGWVKNRPDGMVEIHAEGEKPQLESFIAWCRKGTPAADVTSLDIDWGMVQEFKSFDIHS